MKLLVLKFHEDTFDHSFLGILHIVYYRCANFKLSNKVPTLDDYSSIAPIGTKFIICTDAPNHLLNKTSEYKKSPVCGTITFICRN